MTFDEHTNGQLRIGAQGDQIPLLALPADEIPPSDGPKLASPALEPIQTTGDLFRALGATEGATYLEATAPSVARAEAEPAAQYRVWLESKQGSYWIPGTGLDEAEVRRNLTRTQRTRVRAIKQVTTREAV